MKPSSDPVTADLRSFRLQHGLKMTSTLLALGAAASPLANAQQAKVEEKKKSADGTTELPELVVKADGTKTYKTEKLASPKYVKPLVDVPQTVTVIPKEVIEQQGATTLTEVLRNIPGITMTGGENGNAGSVGGDAVMLRGFDASSSVFLDGVRDNGVMARDSFNTESVSVFQGPTGSDVGRTNAAGYIDLTTKVPHLDNLYQGSVSYGSANRQRYTMDLNQDLSTLPGGAQGLNGAAFRFNGVFQDGGVAGRDYVERNLWGIAPSFVLGLGTDTRAYFTYQHVEQHNIPDYGLPANRNVLAPGVKHDWFYGNANNYDDIEQNTYTIRVEHDFNEHLTLTNQTRYNDTHRELYGVRAAYSLAAGANFGKVTRAVVVDNRDNHIFSNQTNLTSKFETAGMKHTLVTGFEYTKEDQDTRTPIGGGTYAPINPGSEPGHQYPPSYSPISQGPGFTSGNTETFGLYAFDTIDLTSKWILNGGIRMDHYNTSYKSYAIPRGQSSYLLSGPYRAGDEVFSGKLGLVYKPVEAGSIYASYSRSAQPPGSGNFSLSDSETAVTGVNTDPQVSENFEIGAKWDLFDARLSLTGAAFYTENSNFIYQQDPLDANSYTSDGGQKILGFTLGAVGQITENWAVIGSLTHLDGEIDQPGGVIDGNELSRTPDWSASLWSTYKLPKGFTVGLGLRCQDTISTSTADDAPTMAGYAVLDGLVQYDVNERLNFRLNVYNLLDKEYIASTSGGGGGDGGGTGGTIGGGTDVSGNRVQMGAPISFALSANFSF
jgi:catecholate siderophore receptor